MVKYKLVKLPLFNRYFYMYKGLTEDIISHYNNKYSSNIPIQISDNLGSCMQFMDGSSIIMIHKESPSTVAHEINHAVTNFMVRLLQDSDRNHGDEVVSYVMGYLTEKYYEEKGWKEST